MSDQTKTWLGSRLPIAHNIGNQLSRKPLAANQPYLAALGMLITATLLFLVLSGVVLSAYYVAAEHRAFQSIQLIMRDVNDGWLIRSFHATGTTMLFAAVYLAIFRALVTGSYRLPGELVWSLKLVFLLLMLLVGYLGYAMQDSAVSYWSLHGVVQTGAGLASFPANIFNWVFGGPAGPGTLTRLAVMHGLLTFIALGVLALHYFAKQAITPPAEKTVPLHPYYTSHHFVAAGVYVLLFAVLVFFAPHLGENPLNQAPANPLLVPAVTTPPWYLLPATALTHALPGTNGGIIAFIAAFAVLFGMPWLDRSAPGARPGFLYKLLVVVLALDVIALCLVAAAGPSTINAVLTIVFIGWYFLHFLVLTPLATARELN
ncbi:MAG: cytochrome b N-terminal domain-containing protein [Acidocella sp.]|nr:cytochrome b N-terminal domain-containing protein [Acidocella sp.]